MGEQGADFRQDEVDDAGALAPGTGQTASPKHGQMMRYLRLRQVEQANQFRHVFFTLEQMADNLQAGLVPKGFQNAGALLSIGSLVHGNQYRNSATPRQLGQRRQARIMSELLNSEEWVDRYGDLMYRFALVRVKDQDAAEELVQITLMAALQSRDSFQGRSSEKSWLFGILKHKILDHFRQIRQKRNFELEPEDEADPYENGYDETGHWIHPPRRWALEPEKAAENSELAAALARCLDGLSEKFRTVFVMKEVEGLDSAEICKELDIQPTNLWVILHRARNQLKKCLEGHNDLSKR